jgi:hypothetical protein
MFINITSLILYPSLFFSLPLPAPQLDTSIDDGSGAGNRSRIKSMESDSLNSISLNSSSNTSSQKNKSILTSSNTSAATSTTTSSRGIRANEDVLPVLVIDSFTLRAPSFERPKPFDYETKLDGVSLTFQVGRVHAILSDKAIGNSILRCLSGDISILQDVAGGIVYMNKALNITPHDGGGKTDNVIGRFSFVSKNHELLENLSVGKLVCFTYSANLNVSHIHSIN